MHIGTTDAYERMKLGEDWQHFGALKVGVIFLIDIDAIQVQAE